MLDRPKLDSHPVPAALTCGGPQPRRFYAATQHVRTLAQCYRSLADGATVIDSVVEAVSHVGP
jgi:hypothetical protein